MKNKLVNLENTRTDDQRKVMKKILEEGHCPFCKENLSNYHKKPILRETENWLLTEIQWPYDRTRAHLMAITRNHVTTLSGLPKEAGSELFELFQWAEKEYGMKGGAVGLGSALAMRFGESKYSSSTVTHLHAQMIFPDADAILPDESVVFYIGKPQKKTT